MNTKPTLVALLLAAGFLVGCESAPEETAHERSEARWALMIDREFEQAWDYYTPGFRETTPRKAFSDDMKRRPIRWYDAKVEEADCDGDRCTISVEVTYRAIAAPHGQSHMRMTRKLDETWIRLDGQWWYSPN